MAVEVAFAIDVEDIGYIENNPEAAFAGLVKKNRAEVRVKNLSKDEMDDLREAKGKEIKSFLKYKVVEAASRMGVPPGALMKMRWVITKKDTGEMKARLVVLGYTDPGLGTI